MLHIVVVTALRVAQDSPANTLGCTYDLTPQTKALIKYSSSEEIDAQLQGRGVKNEMMQLADCLIHMRAYAPAADKSSFVSMDQYLLNWTLKALSQPNDESVICLQVTLRYLGLVVSTVGAKQPSISSTCRGKQTSQSQEKAAKIACKILRSGVVTNMIWLILYHDCDIHNLSTQLLQTLFFPEKESKPRGSKTHSISISLNKTDVMKLVPQQYVIQTLLCLRDTIANKEGWEESLLLLNNFIDAIRQEVDNLVAGGNSIVELVEVEKPDVTIMSCTSLLLVTMQPRCQDRQSTMHRTFLKQLIVTVLNAVSNRPEYI